MTLLPKAMAAVVATEPGGPDVPAAVERPLPEPGPGEALNLKA
jgi:NADPH2:quinone reductase